MSQNSSPPLDLKGDYAISPIEILYFLKSAYRIIAIAAISGLAISVAYLFVTPNRYQAAAQIAMAQIGTDNKINHLGINIEDPTLLISRLSSPTSFTPQVLSDCGFDDAESLSRSIKLAPTKGVANVVDLQTFGKSQEVALACALSIFELIKATQTQLVTPYIEEVKVKLTEDQGRLVKAKDLVAKADGTGQTMSATYLSTRDEIRYLLDEITALKNIVSSNQSMATRLISPIYAGATPIAPKKWMTLAAGLFGGFFLGLLLTLARQMWGKLKGDMLKLEQRTQQ